MLTAHLHSFTSPRPIHWPQGSFALALSYEDYSAKALPTVPRRGASDRRSQNTR
jgi:hypothetical protein